LLRRFAPRNDKGEGGAMTGGVIVIASHCIVIASEARQSGVVIASEARQSGVDEEAVIASPQGAAIWC